MTKTPETMPSAGGSYIRDANGTLIPQTDQPDAQTAEQTEKPASKAASKAQKEG